MWAEIIKSQNYYFLKKLLSDDDRKKIEGYVAHKTGLNGELFTPTLIFQTHRQVPQNSRKQMRLIPTGTMLR